MFEQSLTITQVEIAREYVALFEKLAGQLVGVSKQVLEQNFMKGLKPDLRMTVRVMHSEGMGALTGVIYRKSKYLEIIRVHPIVNALVGRLLGAHDLGVATPRAVVHAGDKTSRDARSWYMISGDAKSWVKRMIVKVEMCDGRL
ncbi:hypothetical protein Tco_0548827 [Tanacetum coccineum]